jgi:Tol biopolymer transport system component
LAKIAPKKAPEWPPRSAPVTGLQTTPRSRISLRLVAAVAALLLALLLLLVLGRPALQRFQEQRQPLPVGGQIILPADAGLVLYNLADRTETTLVPAPAGQLVTSATWSPDGASIAYGYFHRPAGDPASASEIFVAPARGGEAQPLARRIRPGDVLDMPVWSPDGRYVYFTYFGQEAGRAVQRIERIVVEGGQREVMVEEGYSPSISPDGQSLLFLRDARTGTGAWLLPLAGGEPRNVLSPTDYPALAVPRFSPDGSRFAVAIINVPTASAEPPPLLGWLIPPVAHAHGMPWDIWTFNLQGGDARRLTYIDADDPSPTWSPDGRFIAFWSGGGLYLVSSEGGEPRRILERGGYGPIDWRF